VDSIRYLRLHYLKSKIVESKDYFEKVTLDYDQHRNWRNLCNYCKDETVDYDWPIEFKKAYPARVINASIPPGYSFSPFLSSEFYCETFNMLGDFFETTYLDEFNRIHLKKVKRKQYDISISQ
jgi:hypothetical protein